jgi:hypothetical protein
MIEPQFGDSFSERAIARDHDCLGGNAAGRLEQVFVASMSHDPLKLVQHRSGAHGNNSVGSLQNGVAGGKACLGFVAAANARHRHAHLQPPRNGLDRQAFQVWVVDDQGPPFKGFGLLDWIYAKKGFQREQCADNAGNRYGIRDRIGQCRQFLPVERNAWKNR